MSTLERREDLINNLFPMVLWVLTPRNLPRKNNTLWTKFIKNNQFDVTPNTTATVTNSPKLVTIIVDGVPTQYDLWWVPPDDAACTLKPSF
jgi:hypothetical protein